MNIHCTTKNIPGLIELTVYHLHGLNAVFLIEIIEIDNLQHAKFGSWILFSGCKDDDTILQTRPSSPILPYPPPSSPTHPLPPPPAPFLPILQTKKEHNSPFFLGKKYIKTVNVQSPKYLSNYL